MYRQKLSLKDIQALVSKRGLYITPNFTVQNAPIDGLLKALEEENRRLRDEVTGSAVICRVHLLLSS